MGTDCIIVNVVTFLVFNVDLYSSGTLWHHKLRQKRQKVSSGSFRRHCQVLFKFRYIAVLQGQFESACFNLKDKQIFMRTK